MTSRTPATKKTTKTAAGRTPRSVRTPRTPEPQEPVDVDDVAVVADLGQRKPEGDQGQPGTELAPGDQPQPSGMIAADGQPLKTETITFRGRTMVVQVPDEVQLSIIKRFGEQYGALDARSEQQIEAKKAIAMSGRAISVIQSVLADEDDREWIEDALLRHDFRLIEALDILNEAMARLKIANAPNREERRTAAKKSRLVTD